MKKVIFLAVMISLLSGTIVAYEWEIEVVDPDLLNQHRHYLSLTLDNSDYPHIAYYIGRLNGQPPSTIRYALWTGTDWEISMVDQSNRTSVAVETTSLELDDDGRPHISYTGDDGDSYCLKYALWTGTYWEIQVVDNSSGWVGEWSSLKLDSLEYPHISYYDRDSFCLKYASWNGINWEIEVVTDGFGWCTSLDLNSLEYPHIAYYGNGDYLNYTTWTGTGWEIDNIDYLGNVGSADISLELDSNGYPHISYYKIDNNLRHARWDGLNWIITIVAYSYAGAWNSLALDSQNYPRIAYYKAGGPTWNVWYAYWDGSNWNLEPVNPPIGGGWHCSLALDSQDNPHIAYYDQNNDELEYASTIIVGIEDEMTTSIDNTSVLLNNYPNPFKPSGAGRSPATTISYQLPEYSKVNLSVYNIKGKKVKTLVNEKLDAGTHQVVWNGKDENGKSVTSGIYFYKMNSGKFTSIKKMILLK
ncbi:MAG: T9SS type A sorting domain-containing protein [Candidatus Cloacimonetes bacterium]|nr:T9SS type A sorting domain-containing protein [Candidatus Cloacimonadota bacterium]